MVQIDLHDQIPLLCGELLGQIAALDACSGDQNVQTAVQDLQRFVKGAVQVLTVGQIADDGVGFQTLGAVLLADLLHLFLLDIDDDDLAACLQQTLGHAAGQTLCAAGNDRMLAGNIKLRKCSHN